LRRPRESDIDAIFEYARLPEVSKYAVWKRITDRTQVEEYLSKIQAGWSDGSEYTWILCEKADSKAIGAIAVRIRSAEAELGFILNSRFWNRGYTTEALGEIIRWLRCLAPIERVWATCDADNAPSARVLEKVGLRKEALVPGGMVRPNIGREPRPALIFGKRWAD
jgi:RimJ/RimL family protein N-acetyltransferase